MSSEKVVQISVALLLVSCLLILGTQVPATEAKGKTIIIAAKKKKCCPCHVEHIEPHGHEWGGGGGEGMGEWGGMFR